MSDTPAPRRFHVRMLGACCSVCVDDDPLAEQLSTRLGRFFADEGSEADPGLRVELHARPPRFVDAGVSIELHADAARSQAFGLIFRHLLDRVDEFLVLHAACLARDGRALMIAGPSGSGKTTLSLALVERGFELLSDDFAPVERSTGFVHAFPKALGVRPGAATELADALELAEASASADRPRLPGPAEPTALVFVSPDGRPPDPRRPYAYALEGIGFDAPLRAEIERLDGVSLASFETHCIVLEVDPGHAGTAALERVLQLAGSRVLEHGQKRRTAHNRAVGRIHALDAGDALLLALRELQNRRPQAALSKALGGNPLLLLKELGDQLSRCSFGWIDAGEPRATAAALDEYFSAF